MPPERRGTPRAWLATLVLCSGAQAIVVQAVLLREALVLMYGSEFAWGVVLFAWLLGVAFGALLGGRIAGRLKRPEIGLMAALMSLGAVACLEIWIFRGARAWLGIQPGELLPLYSTAVAGIVCVSPAGALIGFAFPLACAVRFGDPRPRDGRLAPPAPWSKVAALPLGSVYAIESAGSLLGGALFTFWAVEHLYPIEAVLACWGLTAAASAGFLARSSRRLAAVLPGMIALAAVLTAALAGGAIDRRLVQRRWRQVAPGYELVAETETRYQNLAVGRRAEQFTLYSDGHVAADFPDPYTYVPLAHFWMCQHPAPARVLIIGGGAEGLLAEILRHPVEHIDYVEPDAGLTRLLQPFLDEADRRALVDPRVTVHRTDARHFIKTQSARFDLVIARLPEPLSALRARFYTVEFFGELHRAMTPRSVLCLTAAATPGQLSPLSAEYLASIRASLRVHFPFIVVGWGNPAHLLAATAEGLVSTDPQELARRFSERDVLSDRFDTAWFDGATDWLDAGKIAQRAAELDDNDQAPVSTDLHPIIYLQRLALWERMMGARGASVFGFLRSVGWSEVIALALACGGATMLAGCITRRRGAGDEPWLAKGAILLSVGTSGFATMALSIIWLFAFQNLYGYVYQRIGWIVALFMAGLVIGCGLVGWGSARGAPTARELARLWRRLIAVDMTMAFLAAAAPVVLTLLGSMQTGSMALLVVDGCISTLVALTGVVGGAAFALAAALATAAEERLGAAAGRVVGADHIGACLGALLCGILLVPVFGTASAALFLAGIKLAAAGLLMAGRRAAPTGT